jgi:hypothetical protein
MVGSVIRITKDADLLPPPSHRPWYRRTHRHGLHNKKPGYNAAGKREEKGVNGVRQIGKCAISKAKAVEMAVKPI